MQDTLSAKYKNVIFTNIQKIPVIRKYTLPQFYTKRGFWCPLPDRKKCQYLLPDSR